MYALNNRQLKEDLHDVFHGMIQVFDLTFYAFLDLGVSLSLVTPYVAMTLILFLSNLANRFLFSHLLVNPF